MIAGVKIKKIVQYADDRGFFAEILKDGEETFHEVKQTSYTETFPGVIKAFHWHKEQWDSWFCCKGNIQAVLFDMREGSKTKGETQVVYMGEHNPVVLAIPPGVAHGYRALGTKKIGLFYHTSKSYNQSTPDEERIPFDDPSIGFDWNTQNR